MKVPETDNKTKTALAEMLEVLRLSLLGPWVQFAGGAGPDTFHTHPVRCSPLVDGGTTPAVQDWGPQLPTGRIISRESYTGEPMFDCIHRTLHLSQFMGSTFLRSPKNLNFWIGTNKS